MTNLWEIEQGCFDDGLEIVCGVDEAGRGPLAGPVCAAAVILPPHLELPGLNDSKKLTDKKRRELYDLITEQATAYAIALVDEKTIDEINILPATVEAMTRAVCLLSVTPGMIYVDGNKTIPEQTLRARWTAARFPQQEAVVGGDARVDAIAAASVLAKTFRDHVMECLARRWPGYGFEQHKGYGTQAHYAALRRLGPCPQHRLTYKGVAAPESVTCRQGDLL